MEEYEVDLGTYLRVLWEHKWVVIITFIVAVATAIGVTRAQPRQYVSETTLLILPPLAQELGGQITGTVYSPETYRRLALAGDLMEEVITQVYLEEQDQPAPESLRRRISIEVEQTTARDFPGRFPLLLRATFSGSSPELLKRQAEVWADAFVKQHTELFISRTAQSYDYVLSGLTEVEEELLRKEEERKAYRQQYPEEVLAAEVEALQSDYRSLLGELAGKQRELAYAEPQLVALTASLEAEPTQFTLERGPSNEALWDFLGRRPTDDELAAFSALQIREDILNPTYTLLRERVATAQSEVDALRGSIAYIEAQKEETRDTLESRQSALTEVRTRTSQLDREIAAVQAAYESLARKLQEARIARTETPDPIRVVERPLIPSVAVGPRTTMNVAVAGVLGLMGGILLAFVSHAMRSKPEQEVTDDAELGHRGEGDPHS